MSIIGWVMLFVGIIFLSISPINPTPFQDYINFNLFLWIGLLATMVGIIIRLKIDVPIIIKGIAAIKAISHSDNDYSEKVEDEKRGIFL